MQTKQIIYITYVISSCLIRREDADRTDCQVESLHTRRTQWVSSALWSSVASFSTDVSNGTLTSPLSRLLCSREQFVNKERAYFHPFLSFFLFYMLLGTSTSSYKHAVGIVQQIAICTWTGPGENCGRKKERDRERWRGGVCIDRRRQGSRWRVKKRVFKSTWVRA